MSSAFDFWNDGRRRRPPSSTKSVQEIGSALEASVPVFDRRYRLKVYRDSFVGKEAVDFLVRSQLASSRQEAVAVGRRLQSELFLFQHVTRDHEFKDEFLFYRFVDPSQRKSKIEEVLENKSHNGDASKATKKTSLHEMAQQLRTNLAVRDRMYHLKRYRRCFVASEAVDFMLHQGWATSRGDAVAIGRRLARELDLWKHVVDEFKRFDDDYLFFRFNNTGRTEKPKKYSKQSQAKSCNSKNKVATVQEEEEAGGIDNNNNTNPAPTTRSDNPINDKIKNKLNNEHDSKVFDTEQGESSEGESNHIVSEDANLTRLNEVGRLVKKGLKVRTRRLGFKRYKRCFLAFDVVDFLVHAGLSSSRQDATMLAQELQTELKLWQALEHSKEDTSIFIDESIWLYFPSHYHNVTKSDAGGESDSSQVNSSSLAIPSASQHNENWTLPAIEERLRSSLSVKDRRQGLKFYQQCFVASDAVEFMIRSRMANSRQEAVELGQRLQHQHEFWYPANKGGKSAHANFDDDDRLYFCFSKHPRIRSADASSLPASDAGASVYSWVDDESFLRQAGDQLRQCLQVKDHNHGILKKHRKSFVGYEAIDFMVQSRLASSREEAVELGSHLCRKLSLFRRVTKGEGDFRDDHGLYTFDLVDDSECSESETTSSNNERGLGGHDSYTSLSWSFTSSLRADLSYHQIARELQQNVQVKTRTYRLREYRNCFVGSEAVDYLVQSRIAATREEAVGLVRQITTELDFVTHVCGDHIFEDNYLFYRFKGTYWDGDSSSASAFSSSVSNAFSRSIDNFQCPALSTEQLILDGALDRADEKLTLGRALQESEKRLQVIFVHGPSGCGKTTLVTDYFGRYAHKLVFASSSFIQGQCMVPFSTLRALFRDLWEQMKFSYHWKACIENLTTQLDGEDLLKRTLAQWVPEASDILLGEKAERQEDGERVLEFNKDNATGANMALLSLLRVVSRVCNVVLFLDDIMWADDSSMAVLEFLIHSEDLANVVFCFSYQDEKLDNGKLMTLEDFVERHGSGDTIHLRNMSLEEMSTFLTRALRIDVEDIAGLAEVIWDRTNGDLASVVWLLDSLQSRSLLRYDYSRMQWSFSLDEIRKVTTASEGMGELLVGLLHDLRSGCLEVLKLASCFGGYFDVDLMEKSKSILSIQEDVETCLQEACGHRMLIQQSEREYKFAHSRVQAIAYDMLPEGRHREKIHWDIGCCLLGTRVNNEASAFACVDQLKKGLSYLDESYVLRVAAASLRAGYQAVELSAFVVGCGYFKMGIDVLGDRAFTDNYRLSVDLYTSYAETLLVSGDTQKSRDAAQKALKYSQTPQDKQLPSFTLLRCYKADLDFEMEIKYGVGLLAEYGIDFVEAPPPNVDVAASFEKSRLCLKKFQVEELMNLPPMTDATIEFCIAVMVSLVESGYQLSRVKWCCFLQTTLVRMTIKHGYSKWTPVIVAFFANDAVMNYTCFDDARRVAQMALQMQEAHPSDQWSSILMHSSYFLSTIEPVSKSMYIALEGYRLGMEAGQLNYAFQSYGNYCWSFFHSGLPFEPLIEDMENYVEQMVDYKQPSLVLQTPLWQTLLNLSGRSHDPTSLTTGAAVEKNRTLGIKAKAFGEGTTTAYLMQLAFYFDDMEKATDCYEKLKDTHMGFAHASIMCHVRIFFFCLISIENFRRTGMRRWKIEGKQHLDEFRGLVHNGAINLPHKLTLLDAEFSSLSSGGDDAILSKYHTSIVDSSKSGFLQDAAMANLLCARFCLSHGELQARAEDHIIQAIRRFDEWGATAVSDFIQHRHMSDFESLRNQKSRMQRRNTYHRSRAHFRGSFSAVHKCLSAARGLVSLEKNQNGLSSRWFASQ